MKKNRSKLLLLLFFTTTIQTDSTEILQITKTAEVLHAIKQMLFAAADKKHKDLIQFDLNNLAKPFEGTALNAEITAIRQHIHAATKALLDVANQQRTDITHQNFAQQLIQPCFTFLIKNSIYPSLFSKTKKLQILSSFLDSKQLEYQTYEILNRIFLLWRISSLIFHISNEQIIRLEWPTAELPLSEWITITESTAQEIWSSLNPSVQMAKQQKKESLEIEQEKEALLKKQRQIFTNLQPPFEKIEQSKKIIELLTKFLADETLTHELFTKYDFNENIGIAILYLQLMQQKFKNNEKLPEPKLLQEIITLQNNFIIQLNKIYSNYFKKDFAGHVGNKFLVIKHKFSPKADGIAINNLSESEAVTLLTALIVILEAYQELFPEIQINLSYLEQNLSIQKWISTTGNSGFNTPGQFSEELKNSLSKCLPSELEPHVGQIQFSAALQKIKSGAKTFGDSIKTVGSSIKEKAKATGGWFSSTWSSVKNYLTHHVEEELDEL